MTYASTVWGYVNKSHMAQHQTTQNIALQRARKAPWYITNGRLQENFNLESIEEFIRHSKEKFYDSLESSDNPLSREICKYNLEDFLRYKRPKMIRPAAISSFECGSSKILHSDF